MNNKLSQDVDITIAIPTYNGEKRLPEVLDKLFTQIGVEHLTWEVIVVDNNSSDQTAQIIANYQTKWGEQLPLRYFLETEQGAAFARLRAVREAQGKLIAFLDDDNLPAPDWLCAAFNFGLEHPKAGAWGGQIHGNFEVQPPERFEQIQGFLAIREYGSESCLFDPDNLRLPPGAALVVRQQAWCENVPARPVLSGKLPGIFVQGDDYEPILYIYHGGWEIWYNPAMHTYHQIPHWRLKKDYLLTLARGCGLCTFQLRLVNAKEWQKPFIFLRTFFGNFRRILGHILKYKISLKDDLIALFEVEFYWGSMISPFYSLRLYWHNLLDKN